MVCLVVHPVTGIGNTGHTTCQIIDDNTLSDTLFNCTGVPFELEETWIKKFALAIPEINANTTWPNGRVANWSVSSNVTSGEAYDDVFRLSSATFRDWAETTDTDLSEFRKQGGKLLSWRGLDDPLIVPTGTAEYYQKVLDAAENENVVTNDYYRFLKRRGSNTVLVGLVHIQGRRSRAW